ncbi:hypothetical protein Pla52o_55180 [Novipirellula galeiformis]|uniref:DUF5077 domain-containing protein n=2 Tax=Novipirellula galeiformis TaxID=2528004 RepID=A0A5C6BU25_9BACT|nr:hypothetical protein Pla52o_55180 [Novipirellula galeiformis]
MARIETVRAMFRWNRLGSVHPLHRGLLAMLTKPLELKSYKQIRGQYPLFNRPRQRAVGVKVKQATFAVFCCTRESSSRIPTMKHCILSIMMFAVVLGVRGTNAEALDAAVWAIPLAGNAYRTAPAPGNGGFQRDGSVVWSDPQEVYSVFVHIDRAAVIELSFTARVPQGRSSITTTVGQTVHTTTIEGSELQPHQVGRFEVVQSGYVRVDIQGVKREGQSYAQIDQMLVSSHTEGMTLDYVKSNDGNLFYWGRRGPSVHLRYEVPPQTDLQYAYSELTVPQGQDPIGSYFMANGFAQGYFGIQVNGPEERRVLFSVWSPFKTDNPQDIPEDQQIKALAKGPGVHIGEFGNEGSGGQSYLVYPWQAGRTYRFLTEVRPDGKGNTIYTSWFGERANDSWRLIASFERPKTNTHLSGFHSFLENFNPVMGHLQQRVLYGNVRVRGVDTRWYSCTTARFSVDPTGGGRHRLDFAGGVEGEHFYLHNGGFIRQTGKPGETFTRKSSADERPAIDFDSLPRG